jgi:FlaG/FlaF family flagellin (archaellin)
MAFTKKNEDAVSEVISVVLIIAVTLVLAGVIASLVFGVGSNVPKSKVVDVSLSRNAGTPSTVIAVFHGGKDAASVTNISFMVGNVDKGGMCMTGSCTGIKVGCQTFIPSVTKPSTVTVVGSFSDGTKQVLLQQSI